MLSMMYRYVGCQNIPVCRMSEYTVCRYRKGQHILVCRMSECGVHDV